VPRRNGEAKRVSARGVHDIAVVGGGVVGAAAALAFARDGWNVALVESRSPEPWRQAQPDLRVYAIAPDAMALLERLGVGASVRAARAHAYRRMAVWDAAGGGELAFDADRFGRAELGWIVEHALLVDRLWQALPGAGVSVHVPASISGHDAGDGADTLRLDDGQRLRARLVVAADGGASALRGMAGIDAPEHDYRQSGVVAYVRIAEPHADTCFQRFLPGGPLALLPFGPHTGSIVWTLPREDAEAFCGDDDDAFARRLTDASGGRLGAIAMASPRATFPLRRRLARAHLQGRVALIGDAAHVVHPLAGQGVNLGLRDVATLAERLRPLAARGDDPLRARLGRWARERRSANARAAYAFEAIDRVFSNDALLPVLLRGRLLGLAGRLPPLQHALWREAAGL
jgi:2-octaprenyl-3-methyl-6-methoxy-1,4-benzoquinol hydroxylase